jgi:putative transposase
MNIRKDPLVNGQYYHIFSRSIAKFKVFNDRDDYARFSELFDLYRFTDFYYKYSSFKELQLFNQKEIIDSLNRRNDILVEIVAYCIMPTHVHFLLKQVVDAGISKYLARVLNSYTRYFNLKHHRTGPLWEGHFKNVLVKSDKQLLHLTRYIHLNPTSADLVKKPEDWAFSSYLDYIHPENVEKSMCSYRDILDISPKIYRKFVNDRKSYQRELSIIKNILIDEYAG